MPRKKSPSQKDLVEKIPANTLDELILKQESDKKTKSITVLVTPTLQAKVKKKSKEMNLTVSEVITRLLELWTSDVE